MKPSWMVLAATAATTSLLLVLALPARADCTGPTITHKRGTVDRGARLTVDGSGWGDKCYDTGPPPSGQGVFGSPITDIEISFVQGDTTIVVARGRADSDYRFKVDVTVPPGLAPGPVQLVARSARGIAYDPAGDSLTVSPDAPASRDSHVEVFVGRSGFPSRGIHLRWLALPVAAVVAGALLVKRRRDWARRGAT